MEAREDVLARAGAVDRALDEGPEERPIQRALERVQQGRHEAHYMVHLHPGSGAKSLRDIARDGFERKRALNRELATAQRDNPALDFQSFVAARQQTL